MDFDRAYDAVRGIVSGVGKAVIGKVDLIRHVVAALVAGGHVLIEGPPGTGKTLLAMSIAKAIGGKFMRVQGNPDILPTDLTGYYVHSLDGSRRFVPGPVFANVLMFDELNRTPTRVQSALLQAMAENKVSVEGETHKLPTPFHVIATKVSSEEEVGVYPLTLTLRDRFWIKCYSPYSGPRDEIEIIRRADELFLVDASEVEQVITVKEYVELQNFISNGIYVDNRIVKYILDIVVSLRNHHLVKLGPSHRAPIDLYRISKVLALIDKRDYVIPDDVKEVAVQVFSHRIVLSEEAEAEGRKPEDIVREVLDKVEVPKE